MNKFFSILLSLAILVLTGCASNPNFQPQGQTYGAGTHVHTKSQTPNDDIFNVVTGHAVRVPQQDSFSLRWFTQVDPSRRGGGASFQRFGCEITIQPGGSFTAGRYACQSVGTVGGTRIGDRSFVFTDPKLGEQVVNLSMYNGGYLTSGFCDRGIMTPGRRTTYDVQWSTHDTIRGANGFFGQLVRKTGCEVAPRQEVRVAEQLFRQEIRMEQQIARLEQREKLRQLRQELRNRD